MRGEGSKADLFPCFFKDTVFPFKAKGAPGSAAEAHSDEWRSGGRLLCRMGKQVSQVDESQTLCTNKTNCPNVAVWRRGSRPRGKERKVFGGPNH